MPKVYAIGDLHLCLSAKDKSMEVFGARWAGYVDRIADAWRAVVGGEDVVLVPGDVSWAMKLTSAADDLKFIGELPGKKVLLRGNHDYWWSSYTQVLSALPAGMTAVQNNVIRIGNIAVAGSRGWLTPAHAGYAESDARVFEREMLRLQMSLDKLTPDDVNIVMLHYPPFTEKGEPSPFAELIARYPVEHVVYGHLHGRAQHGAFEGVYQGATYTLVAADRLAFVPKLICEA